MSRYRISDWVALAQVFASCCGAERSQKRQRKCKNTCKGRSFKTPSLRWYFTPAPEFTAIDPGVAAVMKEKLKLICEGYY